MEKEGVGPVLEVQGKLHKAIEELYHWQRDDDASNFTSLLYTLISKADVRNTYRLADAFPDEYNAFMLWQTAPDENAFFKTWIKGLP
jgi:hypothetical protein